MADEINGDATVDSTDYAAFLAAYTSERYAPQYDPALDVDGDHRVFNSDYSAFLADEGTSETYTPTGAPFLTVPAAGSSVLSDISPWTNVTNALYYSTQDQVLETRANGTVTSQSVWGLDYVNDLVAYDTNAASGSLGISGSGLGQRLYAQHDANYDVTSLTDTTGTVVERYMYDPYGNVTVLNPDGTVRGDGTLASSHFGVPNLFQGMRYDSVTGLYQTPNRDLSPATGTWMEQDPAGYVDGSDLFQFVGSNPLSYVDPSGLQPPPTQPSTQPSVVIPADGQGTAQQLQNPKIDLGNGDSGTVSASTDVTYVATNSRGVPKTSAGNVELTFTMDKGSHANCDNVHWLQFISTK
jgi:RHS repeat-associated protein